MADEEPRRSGRATKGQHTKNADALDEPIPKTKPKSKADSKKGKSAARSQSAASAEEDEEEEDAIIRCVCGDQRDYGPKMICCDRCEAWQHNRCLHLPQLDSYWEGKSYYCEQCRPEEHQELLALMAKGEKPWEKWSKKGSKPPKSRAIDQKPTGKQDKDKTATPQPMQSAPPSSAATETSAPAQSATAPTPIAVPTEMAADGRTVQAEMKSGKKSQPQSPLGEKRRHESTSEKDGSSKKRRKSSAPKTESDPTQTGASVDINSLPPKHKAMAEKLREVFLPVITSASESRGYQIPHGQTAQTIATRLVVDIDRAAFLRHGEPIGAESPFALQLRSIIFNTKQNPGLVDQLLFGNLKPEDIASMSSEDMASDEKQKQYAALREANEKQMVLTAETGPRFRKTHKGEELVEIEDSHQQQEYIPPPPPQNHEQASMVQSPTQDGHTTVELPEDVGRREPTAVDTTGGADSARRPSTNFDINSVFAQVRSPQNDQQPFIRRRRSSLHQAEKTNQVDADVDRLLKDEDGDIDMANIADEEIVWRGTIEMQHAEPCETVARFVAGGDFNKVVPWTKLLTTNLPIAGRIEKAKGDEYISGLASTRTHDVAVLALSPLSSEARAIMDTVFKYFHERERWGVIPVDRLNSEAMRDLYVIPVPEGGANLPQFMDLLEYCTIETPRKEDMLLLALVAKLPEIPPHLLEYAKTQAAASLANLSPAHAQPVNGINGPSPSPMANPHGPAYSPVGQAFPPNPYTAQPNNDYPPTPTPPQNTQAPTPPNDTAAILGPYMSSSVVQTILAMPYTTDTLRNLRDILDKVPAAREDMAVLGEYLSRKTAFVQAGINGNGN